ncbi:RICIN domain-containing protein [Streptoalloteichus hindustanus]|uniref:Uncharacterized protein n=1 Tax=Streptoalloteichus hindustanus TaxID=2017 RepID=A0A1M4YRC2_STRHI|nr:hypothetical protein [Streptoalloteichus hindustanus]SHF08335.1 hypothetical protein SAMN05444320_102455 [Streptoalloteichus hindustanus]
MPVLPDGAHPATRNVLRGTVTMWIDGCPVAVRDHEVLVTREPDAQVTRWVLTWLRDPLNIEDCFTLTAEDGSGLKVRYSDVHVGELSTNPPPDELWQAALLADAEAHVPPEALTHGPAGVYVMRSLLDGRPVGCDGPAEQLVRPLCLVRDGTQAPMVIVRTK